MPTEILVYPTTEPIQLSEVKDHLRILDTNSDTYLTGLISQAREFAEQEMRRAVAVQTFRTWQTLTIGAKNYEGYIGGQPPVIELPYPPIRSVSLVEGESSPGVFTTLDSSFYVVNAVDIPANVTFLATAFFFLTNQWAWWNWPYQPRFRITYQAGYQTIPAPIKRAILEIIAFWYDYRVGRDEGARRSHDHALPEGIENTLRKYRVYRL